MNFNETITQDTGYSSKCEVWTFILVTCSLLVSFILAVDFFRAAISEAGAIPAFIDVFVVLAKGIVGLVLFPLALFNPELGLEIHDALWFRLQIGSQALQPVLPSVAEIRIGYIFYFFFGIVEVLIPISILLRKIYLELSKN